MGGETVLLFRVVKLCQNIWVVKLCYYYGWQNCVIKMGGKTVLLLWVKLCYYIGVVRLLIIMGGENPGGKNDGCKKNLGGKSAGGKTVVASLRFWLNS